MKAKRTQPSNIDVFGTSKFISCRTHVSQNQFENMDKEDIESIKETNTLITKGNSLVHVYIDISLKTFHKILFRSDIMQTQGRRCSSRSKRNG